MILYRHSKLFASNARVRELHIYGDGQRFARVTLATSALNCTRALSLKASISIRSSVTPSWTLLRSRPSPPATRCARCVTTSRSVTPALPARAATLRATTATVEIAACGRSNSASASIATTLLPRRRRPNSRRGGSWSSTACCHRRVEWQARLRLMAQQMASCKRRCRAYGLPLARLLLSSRTSQTSPAEATAAAESPRDNDTTSPLHSVIDSNRPNQQYANLQRETPCRQLRSHKGAAISSRRLPHATVGAVR